MNGKERQQLARKIVRASDDIDSEHFIHQLLDESILYNIYEEDKLTSGQKAADLLARFAGSWCFIISFSLFLAVWITGNAFILKKAFDPYPFILLNLILSCVSALQAPLIMMSQNRQEEKDRRRSEEEYKINLKSEIIVEDMHYKLDTVIARQAEILRYVSEKR